MSRSAGLKRIESALTKGAASYQKRHGGEMPRGACQHEKVDNRTPFDVLAEKEDRTPPLPLFAAGEGKTPFDELAEFDARMAEDTEELMRAALETHFWLLDFLFADGPHPGKVMRRLYAWVKKYRPELIWDMGYRRLGELLGETGANIEWRVSVLIDDYATAKGVDAVKMPWQRTAEACASYSNVQQGNSNRVGGKRAGKSKAKR